MVGSNGSVSAIGSVAEQNVDKVKFREALDTIANSSPHMARIADKGHDMLIDVTQIAFVNLVTNPDMKREDLSTGEMLVTIGLKGEDGPLSFHPNAEQFTKFAETYKAAMNNLERERRDGFSFAERVGGGGNNGRHPS